MKARTFYLDSMTSNNNDLSNKPKQQKKSFWYHGLLEPIEHFYMQFLLVTTLYIMEPWERLLVMSIFLLTISLFAYSAYVYILFHFNNIIRSTMPNITNTLWINQ